MKRASGIGHLKPFLPGLEAGLEDPEVSELMINGPGNVWVERGGELEPIEAPALTAAALYRAAIHIARPLGLDPATRPILDARLDDGSRVAICTPPASPHVAMTIRRFGGRAFSAEDLVGQGALPESVFRAAEGVLRSRRNILVSGGTGSGKTTLLNALIELLPEEERIVAIEDTLELRIDRTNCLRFEAGAAGSEAPVSIRDLVRHALRHRPDHIVVGEVRGGEAADLLQALNTGHGGSLTTVHANNASSALSRRTDDLVRHLDDAYRLMQKENDERVSDLIAPAIERVSSEIDYALLAARGEEKFKDDPSTVNIYQNQGIIQTGAYSSANLSLTFGPDEKLQLAEALLLARTSLESDPSSELERTQALSLVTEAEEEIQRDQPEPVNDNGTLMGIN